MFSVPSMNAIRSDGDQHIPGFGPARAESQWYAVYTRPHFEKRVAARLAEKQVEHYLPAFHELHQWRDRQKSVEVPVFPSYLFVRLEDSPAERLRVLVTSGVVRILGPEIKAEPIPDSQIEAIRRMLTGSGGRCYRQPWLQAGTLVRVRRGPLKDLQGFLVRVKNQVRLIISIDLLAQSVAAEVDVRDVEPVAAAHDGATWDPHSVPLN
jgi:transcription antitermination factor NusG